MTWNDIHGKLSLSKWSLLHPKMKWNAVPRCQLVPCCQILSPAVICSLRHPTPNNPSLHVAFVLFQLEERFSCASECFDSKFRLSSHSFCLNSRNYSYLHKNVLYTNPVCLFIHFVSTQGMTRICIGTFCLQIPFLFHFVSTKWLVSTIVMVCLPLLLFISKVKHVPFEFQDKEIVGKEKEEREKKEISGKKG